MITYEIFLETVVNSNIPELCGLSLMRQNPWELYQHINSALMLQYLIQNNLFEFDPSWCYYPLKVSRVPGKSAIFANGLADGVFCNINGTSNIGLNNKFIFIQYKFIKNNYYDFGALYSLNAKHAQYSDIIQIALGNKNLIDTQVAKIQMYDSSLLDPVMKTITESGLQININDFYNQKYQVIDYSHRNRLIELEEQMRFKADLLKYKDAYLVKNNHMKINEFYQNNYIQLHANNNYSQKLKVCH